MKMPEVGLSQFKDDLKMLPVPWRIEDAHKDDWRVGIVAPLIPTLHSSL